MFQAIKTLADKITEINQEIEKAKKIMEEPEMLCEIEFALNDISNLNSLKVEHENAIKELKSKL